MHGVRRTLREVSTKLACSRPPLGRRRLNPLHTVSRLCVRPALGCATFSLANGLPSTASASGCPRWGCLRCSAASSVLPRCPTPRRRACGPYGFGLRPPVWRCCCQTPPRSPGSRAESFPTCPKDSNSVYRPRSAERGLVLTPPPVLPSASEHSVGAPEELFHGCGCVRSWAIFRKSR